MSQQKALIIGEAFYPEDFLINDLVKQWKLEGYEMEVLTSSPSYPYGKVFEGYRNKLYQATDFEGIKVHRFPVVEGYQDSTILKVLNYLSFVFFSFWVVLLIGRRFDRVFVYQTGPLTVALPGVWIKKLFGAKLTIWTQDLWPDTVYAYGFKKTKFLKWVLNNLVGHVYRNCDHIFISCKGFEERIREYVSDRPIRWVPNWPIIIFEKVEPIKLPGKFNFTFTGNIGKVQNLINVVKAFKPVEQKYPEAFLNLVGNGSYMTEVKASVEELKLQNVHFPGRRPVEEMPAYFEASDVLFLSLVDYPIYDYMIPSKFPTYLTAQKPIFAIMKGEVPKMVAEYNIGLSAHPKNIEEITKGFIGFLKMKPDERTKLSVNASHLLNEKFDRNDAIEILTKSFWE